MVRLQTLDLRIGVRVPASQPLTQAALRLYGLYANNGGPTPEIPEHLRT